MNQDQVKSCSRLDQTLKDHYNNFKTSVFYSKDHVFSKDRNLITNQMQASNSGFQYIDRVQSSKRREIQSAHPNKRNFIKTAGANSRADMRLKSNDIRVRTSGGSRSKHFFTRTYNKGMCDNSKRCKTAANNSRTREGYNMVIENPEPDLHAIMNYKIMKERLPSNSPPNTRPSTMAK